MHADEQLDAEPAGGPAQLGVHGRAAPPGGGRPDDHGHLGVTAPQPRAAARERIDVVGLAAHHRVDDEGLEPGVPGATRLGGLGVDLARRRRRPRGE